MEVAFAVIGGAEIGVSRIAEGVQALAVRADLDEVAASSPDDGRAVAFDLRVSAPFTQGDAVWCDVEVPGHDGLRLLLDAARTIAGKLGHTIRVLASVRLPMTGADIEIGHRAIDVASDGSTSDVTLEHAPLPTGRADASEAPERLAGILGTLIDAASGGAAPAVRDRSFASARAFRRTPLFESVRLNRLARTILAAKSVVFAPEDNAGNVRVRIDASDGARQISIVTTEEAAALRRVTRSGSGSES